MNIINPYSEPSRRLKKLLMCNGLSVRAMEKLTDIDKQRFWRIYKDRQPSWLYLYEAFEIAKILSPDEPLAVLEYLLGIKNTIPGPLNIPE